MEELLTLPNAIITIVGVIAPLLVQLIVKNVSNELWRFLIATGLSAVTGVAALLILKLPVNVGSLGAFITLASAAYKLFWKPIWKKNGSPLNAAPTTY